MPGVSPGTTPTLLAGRLHGGTAHDRRHRRAGADHRLDQPRARPGRRPRHRLRRARRAVERQRTSSRPRRATAPGWNLDTLMLRSGSTARPRRRGDGEGHPRRLDEPGLAARHALAPVPPVVARPQPELLARLAGLGRRARPRRADAPRRRLHRLAAAARRRRGRPSRSRGRPSRPSTSPSCSACSGWLVVVACIVRGGRRRRSATEERTTGPPASPRSRGRGASAPRRRSSLAARRDRRRHGDRRARRRARRRPAPRARVVASVAAGAPRARARRARSGSPRCTSSTAQRKYVWPHNIQWPTHFGLANTLAWVAASLLLVDVAAYGFGGPVAAARRRGCDLAWRTGRRRSPPPRSRCRPRRPTARGLARVDPDAAARLGGGCSCRGRSPRTTRTTDRPDGPLIALPASGLARSFALLRAFRQRAGRPRPLLPDDGPRHAAPAHGLRPAVQPDRRRRGRRRGLLRRGLPRRGRARRARRARGGGPRPRGAGDPDDETIDAHERHERAVWPGRLLPGTTVAGDGLALPLPDDMRGPRLLLERPRARARTRRGSSTRRCASRGRAARSTSRSPCGARPWGGHETSPWHQVSGELRAAPLHEEARPPAEERLQRDDVRGRGPGPSSSWCSAREDVEILVAEPRYYPRGRSGSCTCPGSASSLTWNLVVLLEKL